MNLVTGTSETPRFSISIVVPAFNESGNVRALFMKVEEALAAYPRYTWQMVFINDGSSDNTLEILRSLAIEDQRVHYFSFSRNFGHQAALKAGLDHATGDCVISMDADLQHPPELLPKLLASWEEGNEVVYTIRQEAKSLPLLKRISSRWFYQLFNQLADLDLDPGAADFRLLDRKVLKALQSFPESSLFLRGLIRWAGFKQSAILYYPNERYSGTTKYSLYKMIRFAADGIFSFSVKPLRIALMFGCMISSLAALYALYAVMIYLFGHGAISGWASVIISVLFLGGIQLLSIGLLGEYIGRVLTEAKRRPLYIISEQR